MSEITGPINVKTLVGEYEILKSGVVHVSDANPLCLTIGNLEMKFIFAVNISTSESSWEAKVDDNILIWKLVNFNNTLGQGLLTPLKLGKINNRELLASFFVWTPNLSEGLRIINYVLYIGKETNE